jgi:uncharacterized cupredoxin-like copper-binding protein
MTRGRGLAAAATAALLVGASGCQLNNTDENVVAGKKDFVAKCGSCHTLKRAGTTGVVGPNLDQAFQQARRSGFGESAFEGIVYRQILQPNKVPQHDPVTGKEGPLMPAKLVEGDKARDVAAYVAGAVAKPGEDKGQLGAAGVKKSNAVAKEADGKLSIPADPSGALAYTYGSALATPGSVDIESQNKSSIDHDISLEGNGVNEHGQVVKNGGVSKITVDVKPGTYTFFCSVPGHREGGMQGKLTVK